MPSNAITKMYRILSPKKKQNAAPSVDDYIKKALSNTASMTDVLIGLTEIKNYLLNQPELDEVPENLKLALLSIRIKLENTTGDINLTESAKLNKDFILDQIKFLEREPPKPTLVNSFTSWEVNGKKHYFFGSQQFEGGEAWVYPGFEVVDDKVLPQEKVLRVIKPTLDLDLEKLEMENKANKVLYPETSSIIEIAETEGGPLKGYLMPKIPGFDFVKAWKYDVINIRREIDDAKEADTNIKPALNEMVLTHNFLYWTEKIGNKEVLKFCKWKDDKNNVNQMTDLLDSDQTAVRDPTIVKIIAEGVAKSGQYARWNYDTFAEKKLTYYQKLQVLRDVFKQLAEFHARGFYHGDINPTNIKIYIDEKGNAKGYIFDFGLSQDIGQSLSTTSRELKGMACFMAPESAPRDSSAEREYGKQTDMYGMAAIVGMMFSEDPNQFIADKLTKQAESPEVGPIVHTPYNFNNVVFPSDAKDEEKHMITTLIEQCSMDTSPKGKLVSEPRDATVKSQAENAVRLSSEDAFQNFNRLCARFERGITLEGWARIDAKQKAREERLFNRPS